MLDKGQHRFCRQVRIRSWTCMSALGVLEHASYLLLLATTMGLFKSLTGRLGSSPFGLRQLSRGGWDGGEREICLEPLSYDTTATIQRDTHR